MHIITKKRLKEFWTTHPNAESSLQAWYKITNNATWQNLIDLQQTFPSADLVGNFIVFNIGGNRYRLIALVDYQYQQVYIRHILTHAEYDKNTWKQDSWFS